MYPLLVVRGDYMGSMVVLNFVFFKSLKLYSYIIIDFQFLFTGEHWMLPRIWIWSQQDEVYEEQQTGVEGNADQLRHPHRWIPAIFGQYVFFCIIIHLPLPRLAVHLLSRMKLAMCTFFPHLFSLGGRLVFLEVEDGDNEGREDGMLHGRERE